MSQLALAISDFALPSEAGSAPRLEGLGRLLARGRREPSAQPGWRHWVLQAAGLEPPERLPVADTLAGQPGCWLVATPVHLLAGLEHLHLDPAGLPVLTVPEWQALAGDFNRVFADTGHALSFDGEVALLSCAQPLDAMTHDPQPLAGRDAGAWLPSGPDGGPLRRLMTEIQMWLHEHPVNAARSRRGDSPVNGLWLWGSGGQPVVAPAGLPGLSTSDVFLRRFWKNSGADCRTAPPTLAAWLSAPDPIATLDLMSIDRDPGTALQRLEEQWFLPLERALAAGSVRGARLLLGATVATLGRHDRLRFWRPRRDWHEALR
jgi:hypothetical protein